jgi:hypothetical protein
MSFILFLSLFYIPLCKGGVDFEKALTVAFVGEGSHSALSGLQVHLAFSPTFEDFRDKFILSHRFKLNLTTREKGIVFRFNIPIVAYFFNLDR